jgi:iron complex transport system substrate-binding protein
MRRFTTVLVLLLSASASAWAARPVPASLSARDDQGTVVTLPKAARRVVALAPNVVESLWAVGAGAQVVGVSAGSDYPPAAKSRPQTGSFSNPDEEAIVALRPDLAVMAHGNPRALMDRLRARKIPVYVLHPRKVSDVLATLRGLGRLTGNAKRGEQLAAAAEKRLNVLSTRLARRPRPRTALLVWDDPITLAGGGAYLNDVITRAGGVNVAADLSAPYPTLDAEAFAVRNPEAILFASHDNSRMTTALSRPGIRMTAAVRSKRVFTVPEDLLLRAGPRLIEGIEAAARRLHPEAFASASERRGR